MTEVKRRGRPCGHVPINKGKVAPYNRKPTRSYLAGVRQLVAIAEGLDEPLTPIVGRLGIDIRTWLSWKSGVRTPSLADFEDAAQVLGYKLLLVPDKQE